MGKTAWKRRVSVEGFRGKGNSVSVIDIFYFFLFIVYHGNVSVVEGIY